MRRPRGGVGVEARGAKYNGQTKRTSEADVIEHAACPSMPPRRRPTRHKSKVWLIRHRVTAITVILVTMLCNRPNLLRFRFQFPGGVWKGEIFNCYPCILRFVGFTKECGKLRTRLTPIRSVNILSEQKCAAKQKIQSWRRSTDNTCV